jgi:hypothetical protein
VNARNGFPRTPEEARKHGAGVLFVPKILEAGIAIERSLLVRLEAGAWGWDDRSG